MKIALITDTHWGVRNDNIAFMDNTKEFLDKIFFPYIDENNIHTVIHLGDLVDRRKYININTAKRLREDFLFPMSKRELDVHFIIGNHDTYFKNTNDTNALREIVVGGRYPTFKIYSNHPVEVNFDNVPILFVPWICDENREQSIQRIKSSSASILAGHLEIQGFEMYRGSIVSHGDDRSLFDRFDMVLSGHYHHRSSDGTVFYLGSHAEFTWSDYDDPRGFHILDTETRELTFIENPYKMFGKLWYDDSESTKEIDDIDFSAFKGKLIKVIVKNKNNPFKFDMMVEKLEEHVLDLQIVEDHLNLDLEDADDIINEAEDTLTIFRSFIDQSNIDVDKNKLQQTIMNLYNKAMSAQ